ncbi:MAG: hypothetical protein SH809_10485 [Rhodothermales bacterium]|nr:hypothetical protein [Rhodothermales bacterium]
MTIPLQCTGTVRSRAQARIASQHLARLLDRLLPALAVPEPAL